MKRARNHRQAVQRVELDDDGGEFKASPHLDHVMVFLGTRPDGQCVRCTQVAAIVTRQKARQIIRALLNAINRAEKFRAAERLVRR